MPKKIIPVPSDFARPKPGAYIKKEEGAKPKKQAGAQSYDKKYKKPDMAVSSAARPKKNYAFSSDDAGLKRPKNAEQRFDKEKKRAAYNVKPMLDPKHPKQSSTKLAEKMPLNKFIAHCGICSRRDAIELIKQGKVKVNGRLEKEPGYKVLETDKVLFEDKQVMAQQKLVYYLLNKPKDYITTTEDPEGRKTVMDLMKEVSDQRIFPVGRLDRNTTGLLLLTNDGLLTQKLSHPKHNIRKIYQVGLDKPLNKTDFEAIAKGLTLEDGLAKVDEIAYVNPDDKKEIGIEIHIGRNRIVRRIFEHLKYEVKTLDRVVYAGLTKKNLPRGKFRALTEKEVIFLKHFK